MMRQLIIIFISILSLQSWTNADDIRDAKLDKLFNELKVENSSLVFETE